MTGNHTTEAQRIKMAEKWFGFFGTTGFFGAIILLAYQAFLWLREGQWTPIPVSSILEIINIDYYSTVDISWTGTQKIVVWLLDLPLSLGIFVFSSFLGALIGYLIHEFSNFKSDI